LLGFFRELAKLELSGSSGIWCGMTATSPGREMCQARPAGFPAQADR
jgi:hypothetical protein